MALIENKCKNCGKQYLVKPYRATTTHYCSKECQKIAKAASRQNRICLTCTKEFSIENWKIKSSYKGNYCCANCYHNRSPQVEVECPCGKRFSAYKSRTQYYQVLYCNRKCYMEHGYKGRLTDEDIEINEYERFCRSMRSTANYLKWIKSCLNRDNNECKLCKSINNLTVHHVYTLHDFVKIYGLDKESIEKDPKWFNINNGETLCRSCHFKTHINGIL